jgi:CRISPR-associated protein Csx14
MAEADIPVDIFNPGQVFACLGFMEVAEVLLSDTEARFDWDEEGNTKFHLLAGGQGNPFEMALRFLVQAEDVVVRPLGLEGPWPIGSKSSAVFPASPASLRKSAGKGFSSSALPVYLKSGDTEIPMTHWLKRKDIEPIKLFAGQQAASEIVSNMLNGDKKKKGAKGMRDIFCHTEGQEFHDPFAEVVPVAGRFGFDARGGWDAMRIGSSLDQQKTLTETAPHVELLAAIGLENSRPQVLSTYQIRYEVWNEILPLSLCRVALFAAESILPINKYRVFRSHLGEDKQYKKIFFAEEET